MADWLVGYGAVAILSSATDAVDACTLLDMLGLDAREVRGSEETAA